MQYDDEYFMHYALQLADKAEAQGEVPVGAVLVHEHKIISEGWNQSISLNDPTAHAEIQALRAAGQVLNNYRLLDTTLYVTLEPCSMCAGALLHARIKRLVFGAYDYKTGAVGSKLHLFNQYPMNHAIDVTSEVLNSECSHKISRFFQQKRLKLKL